MAEKETKPMKISLYAHSKLQELAEKEDRSMRSILDIIIKKYLEGNK